MIPEGEVADSTIAALIGPVISERGQTRIVYTVAGDNDWVIKESRSGSYASNANEWKVWTELRGTEMADLFAECRAVSISRRYLIMRRLEPAIGNVSKPALPDWLTDRKASGLGLASDGSVKVLDYGFVKGEPGKRADALLLPWPSTAAISDMANIIAVLDGDDEDSGGPPVNAKNDVFAGLRDSALVDLERVKADLTQIDAPKVFKFGIGGEVYEKGGAPWARLFADIEAVCPSGVAVVYAISILEGSEEVRKVVRDFFRESKTKDDRRSRDNLRTSQVLYVGSSRKMAVRLREHLGFCSRKTYALKLSEWYPAADLPVELECAVYEGASAAAVAALEDALWERMQPMYGRKGAR